VFNTYIRKFELISKKEVLKIAEYQFRLTLDTIRYTSKILSGV
jgi:hypothetical protein